MEQLVKYLGLQYRYTELHEVWLSNPIPINMLQNFRSYWRFQFTEPVAMKARRLIMLNDLLEMKLINKEQARELVGLDSIDE